MPVDTLTPAAADGSHVWICIFTDTAVFHHVHIDILNGAEIVSL